MDEPLLDPRTAIPTTMSTMVSRLPKFGARPSPAPSSAPSPTNGSHHPAAPARAKGTLTPPAARQNGLIRMPPSFSMKWRKAKVGTEEGREKRKEAGHPVNQCHPRRQQSPQRSPVATPREVKKPMAAGLKARGLGLAGASLGSPQGSPAVAPRGAKPSRTKPGLSDSNGTPRLWSGSSSGYGSGSRPGSPFSNLPGNRSQSSDSLKARPGPIPPLSEENRVRSQSLTQVRRLPSPTLPLSSPSYQRVTERPSLARPVLARSPLAKPSASAPAGFKGHPPATARSGVATPTASLLPPAALKKSLLPGPSPSSKASSLSYRLSRPSLIRQPRPFRVGGATPAGSDPEVTRAGAGRRGSLETPPATPSSTENSPGSTPEAQEAEAQEAVSILGEALEDMSLSSTSSLERNDTSEEYMDDFDNLGNGGEGLLLHSTNYEPDSGLGQSHGGKHGDGAVNGVARVTGLHRFLSENMDWAGIAVSAGRGDFRGPRQRSRRGSAQPDYQQGSSLDLSPADSTGSGGTYIWDEEGLEPLGCASIPTKPTVSVRCGSFDSDLNSTDILNNLENLGSCDLDDDDLMLDEDLPEDGSLHSDHDGMAHLAKWRWKPLCWDTQDVHDDNSLAEYGADLVPGSKGGPGLGSALDLGLGSGLGLGSDLGSGLVLGSGSVLGLDVEELAEDCSAVRAQLEHLQRLLQVEELLKEVQMLRQELRSKDQTITQLTLQLAVPSESTRCHCGDRLLSREGPPSLHGPLQDASTQTPWREPAVILPAPFLSPPWQYQRSRPYKGKPRSRVPTPSQQSVLLSLARMTTPIMFGSCLGLSLGFFSSFDRSSDQRPPPLRPQSRTGSRTHSYPSSRTRTKPAPRANDRRLSSSFT
ncbi:uncharacterized protein FYW47_015093 [Aplochiton taeniatus]